MSTPIRFTHIRSDKPIAKAYALGLDGALKKTGGGAMTSGTLNVEEIAGVADLIPLIQGFDNRDILVLGLPKDGRRSCRILPERQWLFQRDVVGADVSDSLTRTLRHLDWGKGPGLAYLDRDGPGTPEEIITQTTAVIPELAETEVWAVPSSSYGLTRQSDGVLLKPKQGWHVYFGVEEGSDVARIRDAVKASDLGRQEIRSASDALLTRYLVDLAVFSPVQPDFAGKVFLGEGITKDAPAPYCVQAGGRLPRLVRPEFFPGAEFDAAQEGFTATQEQSVATQDQSVATQDQSPAPQGESQVAQGFDSPQEARGEKGRAPKHPSEPEEVSAVEQGEVSTEEGETCAEDGRDTTAQPPLTARTKDGRVIDFFARQQEWRSKEHKLSPEEEARIRSALRVIPSASGSIPYEVWRNIGFALRHYGAHGLELWVTWSLSASPHDAESELRRKWRSFPLDNRVGLGTLFWAAKQFGWTDEPKGAKGEEDANAALPPVAPTVPLAEGRQALADAVNDAAQTKGGVTLIQGTTGIGKTHAQSDLLRALRVAAGREDGRIVVQGLETLEAAEALAGELKEAGWAGVRALRGRSEISDEFIEECDGGVHEAMELVPWGCYTPHAPGVAYALREANHACPAVYCYRGCAIGDNRLMAKKGKLGNPAYPSRCFLDYRSEAIAEATDFLIVSGVAPADVVNDPETLATVGDEDCEGSIFEHHKVEAQELQAAVRLAEKHVAATEAGRRLSGGTGWAGGEDPAVAGLEWLKGLFRALVGDPFPQVPEVLKNMERYPWEEVEVNGREVDTDSIPLKFTHSLIQNWEHVEVESGALVWTAPSPAYSASQERKPYIIFSATPEPETVAAASTYVRILVEQKIIKRMDNTRGLGVSKDNEGLEVAADLAEITEELWPEAATLCGSKPLTERLWDTRFPCAPSAPSREILLKNNLGYREIAARSHNYWVHKDIISIGTQRLPEEALVEQYGKHRRAMQRLGVTLSPWKGGVTREGSEFLPVVRDAKEWRLHMEARWQAQETGRARALSWEGAAPLCHRQFGGLDATALLRTEFGIQAEYDLDMIPDEFCRESVDARTQAERSAEELLRDGEKVTREKVRGLGKLRNDAYSWLVNKSPLRHRVAFNLPTRGVAAKIRAELLAAAKAIGDRLVSVLAELVSTLVAEGRVPEVEGQELELAAAMATLTQAMGPPG